MGDAVDARRNANDAGTPHDRRLPDLNARAIGGFTALHTAALERDCERIHELLCDGADPSIRDDRKLTPLAVAQTRGFGDVVVQFMAYDAFVEALAARDGRWPSRTEISLALKSKDEAPLREQATGSVRRRMRELLDAVDSGDFVRVQRIVARDDVIIDATDKETGQTALSLAIERGHGRISELLLENGAHPHGPCYHHGNSHSLVTVAVQVRQVGLTKRLTRNGALLCNNPADSTHGPLAEAAAAGAIEIVDILLDAGAQMPCEECLSIGMSMVLFRAMEPTPAELNHKPWIAVTTALQLLTIACWRRSRVFIDHLLDTLPQLLDKSVMRTYGMRALFAAVFLEDETTVRELLHRGADINGRLWDGRTPLVAAVYAQSSRMMQLLVDCGGDLDVLYTSQSHSLLSAAADLGWSHGVAELLQRDTRQPSRELALSNAIRHGHVSIAAQLLDDGLVPSLNLFSDCLTRSVYRKNPHLVELLLSRCVFNSDHERRMQLVFDRTVSEARSTDIIAIFLAHGVRLRVDNRVKKSMLGMAALSGRAEDLDVASQLLENGVDMRLAGDFGTALMKEIELTLIEPDPVLNLLAANGAIYYDST